MKQTTIIAGLNVHTYTIEAFSASSKPILVLFFLHGRLGSMEDQYMQDIVAALMKAASNTTGQRDLMIVTFDHRNHGTRLREKVCNMAFKENPRHVLDMYCIQTGTAKDVSFVMDFLPSYLFPQGERSIVEWGVAGISLGGHSTWIAAAADARLTIAIPIIGCPDYLALMGPRAEAEGIAVGPPHFPEGLVKLIRAESVTGLPYMSKEDVNPFLGKKVLVLSGGADPLVPWTASQKFVDGLEVGSGSKKCIVFDGVGHAVPPPMVKELLEYVLQLLG